MENKSISTTYAPLQPPYQIIKYGSLLGMQIGTLIVTVHKGGKAYEIETHSHPVVAYENKEAQRKGSQLSEHAIMEGTVWNNVELRDVTTVCLSDAPMEWEEFAEFLWRDHKRMPPSAPLEYRIFWQLKRLGVPPNPPILVKKRKSLHIELMLLRDDHGKEWVESGDRFKETYISVPLRERWDNNIEAMNIRIRGALAELIAMGLPSSLHFSSMNEELQPLVEELNKPIRSFRSEPLRIRIDDEYDGEPVK